MKNKPIVTLKLASSLDGYLSDCSDERRVFSNEMDLFAVDQLRADSDAILVGGETLRKDNPTLLIKSPELISKRVKLGKTAQPIKVVFSISGNIPLEANFFLLGETRKIIYLGNNAKSYFKEFPKNTEVVELNEDNLLELMLEDLFNRGIRNLLVEAGAKTTELFLRNNFADKIRLAVAPVILADSGRKNIGESFKEVLNFREFKLARISDLSSMAILEYTKPTFNFPI